MSEEKKDECFRCGEEIKVNEPYHIIAAQEEVGDGKTVTIKNV